MPEQLDKVYDPAKVENRIYKKWLEGNYFHAVVDPDKKPYTIVIPPPNITGQLHMGHTLDETPQDILIRVKRMQGYSALWLPGTDHASIATEARIVESMRQEGITKEDIGRDAFLERAWKWNDRFGGRIVEQLKRMGCSCDWNRLRFTMDEESNKAVTKVFVDYYKKGLIYRGERIINWCPACRTSISDAEVEYEEKDGQLWHIKYPLAEGNGYIAVATTRPETMLGDTAVAVNPDDPKYSEYIGKPVILPLVGREIPVISDDYVDTEFGTGAVKITPAHDPNDFEVGQRHKLPSLNILTEDAKINENGGEFAGLDRYEARKKIVERLEAEGYLLKTEEHKHNVGSCYRCNTIIEPWLSVQWFVNMQPLAGPAVKAVEDGQTVFVPERFEKVYFNWMNNIKDWCISRQLWWGHRIPAYYCQDCGEIIVSETTPDVCGKCSGTLVQDDDTLDTWFSSALWPFSTLGWPEETEDFKYFYPTSTLVSGYEIIFFWVARMIFSGIENTGQPPFSKVLIHGMVRDDIGRKMSKSLNNGIDPIDIIEQYGADALRFTVTNGISPGNDSRFSKEKLISARNFANKIWNAARFILMNDVTDIKPDTLDDKLAIEDKWMLSGLNRLVTEVTENIERFDLGIASGKIYDFIWDVFCDWYIEISKMRLSGENEEEKHTCKSVLVYGFTQLLKLLHPIMPFITEEVYQSLPHTGESIMISEFPVYTQDLVFEKEEYEFSLIMDAVKTVRTARADMNVAAGKKVSLFIETSHKEIFERGTEYFIRLAGANKVEVGTGFDIPDAVRLVSGDTLVLIPMRELVDKQKELERLGKEKEQCEKNISTLDSRLKNENFTSKAPPNIVEAEREKLIAAKEKLKLIEQSITKLV